MSMMSQKLMLEQINNAKQMPKRLYGLHFYPGVAQYPGLNEKGEPRRLLVTENAIRSMEPSFECRPVFVEHKNLPTQAVEREADGWVIRSFYNQADGKHWVEFLVTSDQGHEAIRKGWRLSNAYEPTQLDIGGEWNCVPYERELINGKYNHLALVEQPRYDESVIMTPEQFSSYNSKLLEDLKRVDNSKEQTIQPKPQEKKLEKILNFFKKTPTEVDAEMVVQLKSGKTVTLGDLVQLANDSDVPETQPTPGVLGGNSKPDSMEKKAPEAKKDESEEGQAKGKPKEKGEEEEAKQGHREDRMDAAPQMANMDHHVSINGKAMSVKDLMASHEKMSNCMNALAEHHMKMQSADLDSGDKEAVKQEEGFDKTARNVDEDGGEKDASKAEKSEDKTARNDASLIAGFMDGIAGPASKPDYFNQLKNAASKGMQDDRFVDPIGQGHSGVALGKAKYGKN